MAARLALFSVLMVGLALGFREMQEEEKPKGGGRRVVAARPVRRVQQAHVPSGQQVHVHRRPPQQVHVHIHHSPVQHGRVHHHVHVGHVARPRGSADRDKSSVAKKATAGNECSEWCARKVLHPRKYPNGSLEESEKCSTDEKGQPWNNQCTWNIVCGYNSGKCKACPQCESRCEPWCEGKLGKQECGVSGVLGEGNKTCTREDVCGFGNGVKCSDCNMCRRTCSTGVRSNVDNRLCCKHSCGSSCGQSSCAVTTSARDCCGPQILSANSTCGASPPPCILDPQERKNITRFSDGRIQATRGKRSRLKIVLAATLGMVCCILLCLKLRWGWCVAV